jgi:putative methyltransferase
VSAARTVLVSEPAGADSFPFHPYMWAVLKTYAERHGDLGDHWRWLDPMYRRADAGRMLAPYRDERIDLLGLSCYTWNFELQLEIAREVRAANPGCLVVAGGPEPDLKDPLFFERHPELDAVVVKDGEVPFTLLLEQMAKGTLDLTSVPGLVLPRRGDLRGVGDGPHVTTLPPVNPASWADSPYLAQSAVLERLAREHGPGKLSAVWETNRGCPYGCTFCDWGSATLSKIRAFDLDRARAEADWLGRVQVGFVFLADANFGILPRDLQIADWINEAYERHGFPRAMYYSPAKNNPERTVDIARRFARSGISAFHTIAVQHTDPEVLACVDRANISVAKQRQVVRALLDAGVPLDVHLIVGLPGDTVDRWKTCLATLMEWGAHQEYIAFPFSLLPNAPAAEPAYREKWRLRSIRRDVIQHQGRRPLGSRESLLASDVVVSTATYSEADWVEMRTYLAFVQAFHNCSLTRLPALYLRLTHGVPYDALYRRLVDDFARRSPLVGPVRAAVEANYARILADPAATDDIELTAVRGAECHVETSRFVVVRLMDDLDAFYDELGAWLIAEYPQAGALGDLVRYQRGLVVRPTYDPRLGASVRVEHDWPSWFAAASRLSSETLPEPLPSPGGMVVVTDGGPDDPARYDFEWPASGPERFLGWLDNIMLFRRAAGRANFRRLQLVAAPVEAASPA